MVVYKQKNILWNTDPSRIIVVGLKLSEAFPSISMSYFLQDLDLSKFSLKIWNLSQTLEN